MNRLQQYQRNSRIGIEYGSKITSTKYIGYQNRNCESNLEIKSQIKSRQFIGMESIDETEATEEQEEEIEDQYQEKEVRNHEF